MLHRLEIENFYSIRDRQVIDLRAAGNAPDEPGRLAPLWKGSKERAPKVVAIFGANGSGKSNVLKALSFLAWFLKDSFSAPRVLSRSFARFGTDAMFQRPTRLAVHLSGPEDISQTANPDIEQCEYAYEFTIGGGLQPRVENEKIYYWPAHTTRRVRLFERNSNGGVNAAKAFGLAGYKQALEKVLSPEASAIATLAQLEHPFSKRICNTVSLFESNIFLVKLDTSNDSATKYYAENPMLIDSLNREVERFDLGIQKMEIQQGPNGLNAFFVHNGLSKPLPMLLESHGTQNFFRTFPSIWRVLETGGVSVLDELDASIHPMLMPEIIRWFYDPVRNPHNAQLWMSCQNATLLEDLIKEEVLFCEKDSAGSTRVYGLSDIQSVHRDDNYYKKYLGGAFGAVPQIG